MTCYIFYFYQCENACAAVLLLLLLLLLSLLIHSLPLYITVVIAGGVFPHAASAHVQSLVDIASKLSEDGEYPVIQIQGARR